MIRRLLDYYGTRHSDGTSSLSPKRIPSSMRRQLIDYSGTRHSDGTSSLSPKRIFFIHEATNNRLLQYSNFGWDKFPISQEDFLALETTIDRLPRYSAFRGISSLPPKRIFRFHEATTDRLLRYSTFGWDKFPISKKNYSSMI